ncbi:MAG TPA: UDP-N-acetylglucosamine 2-epimerase (non-hydrolyzing) [Candidatus Eisenbergiella merdavium]|uniref:UDP-N-acetylglucosamine 2-epimerase (non-hydrolyzing) n=1 Tax=Candidatus Eisenbergiella merdavium TaxID=2838551 RepID=A0A9D2SR21_9FIRM|nr:UDP-N-acetylglucosamine 2-epimerase (non-hydrolyzing) [Candidatus Eisenbergiella merdavium]
MKKIKVLSIFGTRPEAIKMCPLIKKLEQCDEIENLVCVTGQHRQMLDQVLDIFSIRPDYDLNLMKDRQTLTTITTSVLSALETLLKQASPDLVLVHGDTTTSSAAALAAFYQQIPVGHVEAGLRTYDIYSPFPEEMNRKIISQIAELFFAPTVKNRQNLERENIRKNVFVTGNTVIDAFQYTIKENYRYKNEALRLLTFEKKRYILMTAHRRENLGIPLANICRSVLRLVQDHSDVEVIYPVHLNPAVRETVFQIMGDEPRIHLIDPIDVEDMHNIMSKSYLVMTDSGGLQEEGPHFGIPVVVLRTETERPEAVEAGTVVVSGTEENAIYNTVSELLNDQERYSEMAHAVNPYGDGHASERIVREILTWSKTQGLK